MTRIVFLCLIWLSLPLCARAGPWPRQPGHSFVSTTTEMDRNDNSYTSLYTEYGLTSRRVLGLELGYASAGETSLMLWYQKSLDRGEGSNKIAYSMGAGVIRRKDRIIPQSQASLMWGRGFSGVWDGGWITAEGKIKISGRSEEGSYRDGLTMVEYSYLTPEIVSKLDLTLGLRPVPDWALVQQLRFESRKDQDPDVRLVSSVVRTLSGPLRLEGGIVLPLAGAGEPAVRLGTWLEF